jgi:DNA-binding response OmpR family regulator
MVDILQPKVVYNIMYKGLHREILIVDDKEFIRTLLSDFFSFNGYEVFLAINGKEALDIIKNKSFSLVITDMDMPLMDGIELVKRIRKINISLPIIGMSIENKESEFLKAGADHFLLKPFNFNHLKSILHSIFEENIFSKRLTS